MFLQKKKKYFIYFICFVFFFFNVRYALEIHIVHFKKEYGTFENAQNYSDGVCVIGFFGEVISIIKTYI